MELIFKGIVVGTVSLIITIVCYHRTSGFKLLSDKVTPIIAGIKGYRR